MARLQNRAYLTERAPDTVDAVANRAYLTERAPDTIGAVANRAYLTERADFFAPSMLGSAHNFARKSAMHS